MTRRRGVTLALVMGVVALFALPLLVGAPSDYAGTDNLATEAIKQSNPDYVPWFDHVFTPGSTEIESGLFALQAAIGGVVLGYVLGRLRGKRGGTENTIKRAGDATSSDSGVATVETADSGSSGPL